MRALTGVTRHDGYVALLLSMDYSAVRPRYLRMANVSSLDLSNRGLARICSLICAYDGKDFPSRLCHQRRR